MRMCGCSAYCSRDCAKTKSALANLWVQNLLWVATGWSTSPATRHTFHHVADLRQSCEETSRAGHTYSLSPPLRTCSWILLGFAWPWCSTRHMCFSDKIVTHQATSWVKDITYRCRVPSQIQVSLILLIVGEVCAGDQFFVVWVCFLKLGMKGEIAINRSCNVIDKPVYTSVSTGLIEPHDNEPLIGWGLN